MKMKAASRTVIIGIALILVISQASAFACTPISIYKMNGGLVNKLYYIDLYTASDYVTLIEGAIAEWNAASTKIEFSRTMSASAGSKIDIFATSTYPPGTPPDAGMCAWTELYIIPGQPVSGYTCNWDFARIFLYNPLMSTLSSFQKYGTIGHEFGHCFGLYECSHNNPAHLMYRYAISRTVCTPQTADVNAVNSLYS